MNSKRIFFITVLLTVTLFFISMTGIKIGNFEIKGADQMRYGIDIRGGVEATYEPKDLGRTPTENELEAARTIIETRMDAKNITDRDVTVDKSNGKIIVRFPWKSDEADFNPQKAVSELGETAKLTFRDPDGNIVLEGTDIAKSSAQLSNNNTNPVVVLELSAKGAVKFSEATGRLIGQKISIYMDETPISSPTVETQITGGHAEITNMESLKAASALANKINSGSLPFSLVAKNCNIISPTLGSNALAVMVMAGKVAFMLVCLFMLLYYRLPGLVACIALVLQVTGQLLALSVPQFTLTLPGIAGVILSIGMGVDANIIVSERIKEEIKTGKTALAAVNAGFERAAVTIIDSNLTTLIAAVVLYQFGTGPIKGFAVTLTIGILASLFTALIFARIMFDIALKNNPKLKLSI